MLSYKNINSKNLVQLTTAVTHQAMFQYNLCKFVKLLFISSVQDSGVEYLLTKFCRHVLTNY